MSNIKYSYRFSFLDRHCHGLPSFTLQTRVFCVENCPLAYLKIFWQMFIFFSSSLSCFGISAKSEKLPFLSLLTNRLRSHDVITPWSVKKVKIYCTSIGCLRLISLQCRHLQPTGLEPHAKWTSCFGFLGFKYTLCPGNVVSSDLVLVQSSPQSGRPIFVLTYSQIANLNKTQPD